MQEGKMKASEEALQIVEKRREAKGKRERERYTQLNAEFQRIARRDKKAFFSNQCKKVKWLSETNTQGKKRSERQGRKGEIYSTECRVSENSKER